MVKRVCCLLLAVWILVAPVFALDNTLGVISEDLNFLGFTITSYRPASLNSGGYYFSASDGVCYKRYLNQDIDYDLSRYQYLGYVFDCSQVVGVCDLSGNFVISAPGFVCDEVRILGGTLVDDSYQYSYLETYVFSGFNPADSIYSSCVVNDLSADLTDYDIVTILLHNSSDSCILDSTFSFSESGTLSGSSSDTFYLDQAYFYPPTYKLKASVKLSENTSQPLFQYYDSYMTIYPYSAGVEFGSVDGSITSDGYGQMMGTVYGSSTMSLSESGIISASSASDVMAYGLLNASYGDDGGLVDEVFDQGETLDQIAGDMSQIVEDMQAKQDAANDIGGATTQDQIDNASATVTTGTAAINDFSDTALGSVQSHVGIFNGYAGLIGNALTIMGNFGTGALGTSWLLLVTVMIAMIAIKYALKSGG